MQTEVVPHLPTARLLHYIFPLLLQCIHTAAGPQQQFSDLGDLAAFWDCHVGSEECDQPGASEAIHLIQTSAYLRKAPAVAAPTGEARTSAQPFVVQDVGAWNVPPGGTAAEALSSSHFLSPNPHLRKQRASNATGLPQVESLRLTMPASALQCSLASSSLHLEMEALRRTGQLQDRAKPCDVAAVAEAWLGPAATLQLGSLRDVFGLRSGQRHVTASMYIVMVWAAFYVLLILRLSGGLLGLQRTWSPGRQGEKGSGKQGKLPDSVETQGWRRSFFSWVTLCWATPLVTSLASRNPAEVDAAEELDALADPDDSTEVCCARFLQLWVAEIREVGLEKASLKRVLLRFVGYRKLLLIVAIVFLMQLTQYVLAIFSADLCLGYVDWMLHMREEDPRIKFQLAGPCIIMIVCYTVVPLLNMVLLLLLQLIDRRIDLRNEAALGMMIYGKALRLPIWYSDRSDRGNRDTARGPPSPADLAKHLDVVQLLSVDVKQNCAALASSLSSLCCIPAFAIAVVAVAWYHMGRALLFGVLTVIPTAAFIIWLGMRLQYLMFGFQAIVDRRLTLLREVLFNIRVVKCYGWEEAMEGKILTLRNEELSYVILNCTVMGSLMAVLILLPKLFSVGSLVSLLWAQAHFHAHLIFVALQTLKNFLGVVQSVQGHVMKFLMAWPSLQRLEFFLKLPEVPERPRQALTPPDPPRSQESRDQEDNALRLRGNFAWGENQEPVLRDLDLSLRRGALVAVVGEVGAGKSALLQAILGELCTSGANALVEGPERAAYCAQTPWITAGTVRENILGASAKKPDDERYAQAISAAALYPDLEAWAGGDAVQVGGRGLVLSGGQRMRVALARTVYDSADLLLLDDPLAAVDTRTGETLLQHLVTSDILNQRTRIVVIQPDVDRLARFDKVIVLSKGRIIGHGTPAEIMDSMSLGTFVWPAPAVAAVKATKPGTTAAEQPAQSSERAAALYTDESLEWANWDSLFFLLNQGKCRFVSICAFMQLSFGWATFMSEVQFALWANSKHDFSRTLLPDAAYIVASGVWAAVSALISGLNVGSAVFFAKNVSKSLFGQALRSVLRAPMTSFHDRTPVGQILARLSYDMSMVDRHVFGKLMSLFGEPFFLVFGMIFVHAAMPRAFSLLSLPFYGVILWLGRIYLRAVPAIALLNRGMVSKVLVRLIEVEDMRVAVRAHRLLPHFQERYAMCNDHQLRAQFLATPTLGLWFRVRVATITILMTTLIALCSLFAPQHLKPGTFALCVVALGHVIQAVPGFIESIANLQFEFAGVRRIKEYCELPHEGSELGSWESSAESTATGHSDVTRELLLQLPFLQVEPNGGCVVERDCSSRCILLPSKEGMALVPAEGAGFADLVDSSPELPPELLRDCRITAVNGVSGSAGVLAQEVSGPAGPRLLRLSFGRSWLSGGTRVQIEDLTARYRSSADVLRGVNLSIPACQRVGVVGRTGCGKSTLLHTLLRILEPRSGRILLNGIDTASVGLPTLRRAVGLVPQEPVLFSGSIRQNLDPTGQLSDQELWEALRQVRAAQCVESLPGRLEFTFRANEGGGSLSTGQRQLLCLARVVPRRPGLLLLDEATSAMDPCTEESLISGVFMAFQHSTIVAVAHKLQTILSFDYCVVMDSGLVVEQGLIKDLQQDSSGVFSKMLSATRNW